MCFMPSSIYYIFIYDTDLYLYGIERKLIQNSIFIKIRMFLKDHIFRFCLKATELRHFCILATPMPLRFFLLLVFVFEGRTRGGIVTSHVDIGRKKRKERPLGWERWWLIFVQTRLQTVWREKFRTIFKVTSREKALPAKKSRVVRR